MREVIRWEEPPPSPHEDRPPRLPRLNPWSEVVADLIDHPGRWAVVYEGDSGPANGLSNNIRHSTGPWAAATFDSCSRKCADGVSRVYARCLGEVTDWRPEDGS